MKAMRQFSGMSRSVIVLTLAIAAWRDPC